MRSKILWLTFKKLGKLFLLLVLTFGIGVMSMLAGQYFLGDPNKGLSISFLFAIVVFVIVFAYDQSKMEVEREHNDLIRKIKK